jgi:hypothetical protein
MSASAPSAPLPSADPLHVGFLSLLPRIELHATIYFRHVRCPQQQADCIAETVAVAWKWFARLAERGKDVFQFPMAFAALVVRAVHSGRRLCGHEKAKDVLSAFAQRRQGFRVEALPQATSTSHERLHATPLGQQALDAFEERLRDNTQTPVPDQVVFRIDFPVWRGTRSERDRRVIDELLAGGRTKDVSQKFGLTPGRVSQLRRDFLEDWRRFTDEVEG